MQQVLATVCPQMIFARLAAPLNIQEHRRMDLPPPSNGYGEQIVGGVNLVVAVVVAVTVAVAVVVVVVVAMLIEKVIVPLFQAMSIVSVIATVASGSSSSGSNGNTD